jgi:hypothetical protein
MRGDGVEGTVDEKQSRSAGVEETGERLFLGLASSQQVTSVPSE